MICRVRGYVSGMACRPAMVRPWRVREIQRLHVRAIPNSDAAGAVIREVVGSDLGTREHVVAVGLDTRGYIVSIADAVSIEKGICAVRQIELLGNLFRVGHGASSVVSVIVGHNHAHGAAAEPTRDDLDLTESLVTSFEGLNIMDHVIVDSDGAIYSIRKHHPEIFAAAA